MSLRISFWKLSGIYSHTENPFDIPRTNNRAIIVNDLLEILCVCVCTEWPALEPTLADNTGMAPFA